MIPMSSSLVLEHHILNFMPSFILSISYVLKDGWVKGEETKTQKNLILIAITIYLIALMVWHYIRIPSFIAL
jgi:hypothetical protein